MVEHFKLPLKYDILQSNIFIPHTIISPLSQVHVSLLCINVIDKTDEKCQSHKVRLFIFVLLLILRYLY